MGWHDNRNQPKSENGSKSDPELAPLATGSFTPTFSGYAAMQVRVVIWELLLSNLYYVIFIFTLPIDI